jgi:protoporphyrinogen oxidase
MNHPGQDKAHRNKSVAIIGGGLTGIVIALELARTGLYQITLFEKESQLGGLNSYYEWGSIVCDQFYHVILATDKNLLGFIRDLNLDTRLFWRDTKSGFYGQGKLASFSSIKDFLNFPFMSVWQKIRMGMGILYITRKKNPRGLDKDLAKDWLTKIFGQEIYQNIWRPLLRSKLGDATENTVAAFIWATILRLYGARRLFSKREKMGYITGGYFSILTSAEKMLADSQVRVIKRCPILGAELDQGNGPIVLATKSQKFIFDKVVFTIPSPDVLGILNKPDNHPYWRALQRTEYLSVICALLILSRRLSPFYVINLLDQDLPFTGIIESTNIIPPRNLDNKHLVYLPKYVVSDDPYHQLPEEAIASIYLDHLKRMFPGLKDKDILHTTVFKKKYIQPILGLNFLSQRIGFRTPFRNIYLANSSMIYDSTLNNNAMIGLARGFSQSFLNESE